MIRWIKGLNNDSCLDLGQLKAFITNENSIFYLLLKANNFSQDKKLQLRVETLVDAEVEAERLIKKTANDVLKKLKNVVHN